MLADCPKCAAEMAVEYEDEQTMQTCRCAECGARFEVEADADFNGDHFVDCSTPGKELPPA